MVTTPVTVRDAVTRGEAGRPRPRTATLLLVLAAVLAVAGLVVNLWRPLAPSVPSGNTDLAEFPADALAVLTAYRGPRYLWGLAVLLVTVAGPVAVAFTAAGRRLVHRLVPDGAHPVRRAAGLAGLVVLVTTLLTLPLDLVGGFLREGEWGFRTAPLGLWLRDWALAALVGAAIAAAAAALLLVLVRRLPGVWHLVTVPAVTAVAGLLVLLHPVVITPLFTATRPLEPGPVRAAVEEVLEAMGEGGLEIGVADASRRTTRANAFVTGLGPTATVTLYDTLVALPPDLVAVTVAHEIAHREHHDLPRGVLLTATGAFPALLLLRRLWDDPRVRAKVGASGPTDARMIALALAFVSVAQVVGQPPAMWFSRRAEAAADHRALTVADASVAFIELQRTFVLRDLADPDPPAWVGLLWGSHPSAQDRIRAAAASSVAPLPPVGSIGPPVERWHPRLRP